MVEQSSGVIKQIIDERRSIYEAKVMTPQVRGKIVDLFRAHVAPPKIYPNYDLMMIDEKNMRYGVIKDPRGAYMDCGIQTDMGEIEVRVSSTAYPLEGRNLHGMQFEVDVRPLADVLVIGPEGPIIKSKTREGGVWDSLPPNKRPAKREDMEAYLPVLDVITKPETVFSTLSSGDPFTQEEHELLERLERKIEKS